jgi:hypothetical protein
MDIRNRRMFLRRALWLAFGEPNVRFQRLEVSGVVVGAGEGRWCCACWGEEEGEEEEGCAEEGVHFVSVYWSSAKL